MPESSRICGDLMALCDRCQKTTSLRELRNGGLPSTDDHILLDFDLVSLSTIYKLQACGSESLARFGVSKKSSRNCSFCKDLTPDMSCALQQPKRNGAAHF